MPGVTGLAVAGLWYLLLALAAPAVAIVRLKRGEEPRWALAFRSFGLAVAMIAAFVVTGIAVGKALSAWRPEFIERARTVTLGGSDQSLLSLSLQIFGGIALILIVILSLVLVSVVRNRARPVRR